MEMAEVSCTGRAVGLLSRYLPLASSSVASARIKSEYNSVAVYTRPLGTAKSRVWNVLGWNMYDSKLPRVIIAAQTPVWIALCRSCRARKPALLNPTVRTRKSAVLNEPVMKQSETNVATSQDMYIDLIFSRDMPARFAPIASARMAKVIPRAKVHIANEIAIDTQILFEVSLQTRRVRNKCIAKVDQAVDIGKVCIDHDCCATIILSLLWTMSIDHMPYIVKAVKVVSTKNTEFSRYLRARWSLNSA